MGVHGGSRGVLAAQRHPGRFLGVHLYGETLLPSLERMLG